MIDQPVDENTNVPNISLLYVAEQIKKENPNAKIHIVDYRNKPYPENRHLEIEAEFICFSVRTKYYEISKKMAKEYRALHPQVKIWVGGVDPSLQPEKYHGWTYEISTMFYGSLDVIPDWKLLDSYDYLRDCFKFGDLIYPLITTKGCPYQCSYCSVSRVTGKFKNRDTNIIREELKLAKKEFGITSFQILDDNFTMDKEHASKCCSLFNDLELDWICPNGLRADTLTNGLVQKMEACGCKFVSLGVESSDPEVFKRIKKGETLKHIDNAIKLLQKWKIGISTFFIIGLPGSTPEKDLKSLEWAKERNVAYHFNMLVPYPGTPLWDELKDKMVRDHSELKQFGIDAKSAVDTEDYPASERERIYKLIMGDRQ